MNRLDNLMIVVRNFILLAGVVWVFGTFIVAIVQGVIS